MQEMFTFETCLIAAIKARADYIIVGFAAYCNSCRILMMRVCERDFLKSASTRHPISLTRLL